MEIETDKTAIPVMSPGNGVIEAIHVKDGDIVKAEQKLFTINVTGDAPKKSSPTAKPAPPPPKPPEAAAPTAKPPLAPSKPPPLAPAKPESEAKPTALPPKTKSPLAGAGPPSPQDPDDRWL